MSSVRDAFVTSVACTVPPVSWLTRKQSIVPKASSPLSARARAPATWSSSHAIFVPLKYASMTRPVFSRTRATMRGSFFSSSHTPAVRRHCHTIARSMAFRVARSQTTVVSRWLVMPIAATSAPVTPAAFSAPVTLASTLAQISRDVVRDPAGLRVVLRELGVGAAQGGAVDRQHERGGAGGALVDGQEVAGFAGLGGGHGGCQGGSLDVRSPSRVVSRDNGPDRMDRDPFDLVGDTLDGQFRVVAFAGQGDLSVVYKGHHIGVDAPVAIKCLDLPTTLDGALVRPMVESFREASRLHYKLARGNLNIAQSIASGTTLAPATGMIVPYLVREWFEGESLRAELARRREEGKKGRGVDEVIAMLEPVVDAVAYAHGQGELHLSLNPSSLFLSEKAGKRSLKVLDFGVARAMNDLAQEVPPESRPSVAGLRVLFPGYAAPEQLDATVGKLGPWTDVYALALLMMELLSDRPVMDGHDTGAVVERALDEARRPTPRTHGLELPRNLDLVLTRAVARAPERRQKSAKDFWGDLKTSLRGTTSRGFTAARPPSKPTSTVIGMAAPTVPAAPAVAGAVPGRRLVVPAGSGMETIPLGFAPAPPSGSAPRAPAASSPANESGPTYVPLPEPVREQEPDLPPVHVMATPPPPQVAAPVLPPVIVALDSPLPHLVPPRPPPPPPAPEYFQAAPPLPPRPPPQPTFPILDAPVQRRRSGPLLASLLTGIVGASMGVGLVVYFKHRMAAHASVETLTPSAAVSAPPPPASASAAPSTSASASTGASPSAAPSDSSGTTAHLPVTLAKQALDAAAHDIAHCKRGKVWGISSASVTFGNDGAVSHIAIGVPFTGTATGQCVSDALSAVKVQPYTGKPVIVTYRFFVPIK